MQVILNNVHHPEYGSVTVKLPISRAEYDHVIQQLETMGIGAPVRSECWVLELSDEIPVLKRLELETVNIDELDYLVKRLDSFDPYEVAQFEAAAARYNISTVPDFINLTFCCQQATVITDFSDLTAVGRRHFMTVNGGCAPAEELEVLDGYETALLLIDSGAGVITPYGVVYDNGMEMKPYYDGKYFPGHSYEQDVLTVMMTSRLEPEDTKNATWFFLPASRGQIDRAMLRAGITDPRDMHLWFSSSDFPEEVEVALDFEQESIYELNDLASAFEKLPKMDRIKLGAVVEMAEPESAAQIRRLAEYLDLFEFAPGAHTPAEYGQYMIRESGRFKYDPNLEEFYDYEKYGLQRINQEYGIFADRGYISYQGAMSLDELMMEDPAEQYRQEMGGMA